MLFCIRFSADSDATDGERKAMGNINILTEHQEEWIYYWWNRGYTLDELANALWVSRSTIRRSLDKKQKGDQKWRRKKPPLKYDKNWRAEDGQA